jgi:hypothetical protein
VCYLCVEFSKNCLGKSITFRNALNFFHSFCLYGCVSSNWCILLSRNRKAANVFYGVNGILVNSYFSSCHFCKPPFRIPGWCYGAGDPGS